MVCRLGSQHLQMVYSIACLRNPKKCCACLSTNLVAHLSLTMAGKPSFQDHMSILMSQVKKSSVEVAPIQKVNGLGSGQPTLMQSILPSVGEGLSLTITPTISNKPSSNTAMSSIITSSHLIKQCRSTLLTPESSSMTLHPLHNSSVRILLPKEPILSLLNTISAHQVESGRSQENPLLEKSAGTGTMGDVPVIPALGDKSTSARNVGPQTTKHETRNVSRSRPRFQLSTKSEPTSGGEQTVNGASRLQLSAKSSEAKKTVLPKKLDLWQSAEANIPSRFSSTVFASHSAPVNGFSMMDEYEYCDSFLPKYRRGFGWNENSQSASVTTNKTKSDSPLPQPPAKEFKNQAVKKTISDNPHLFKVSTPLRVNRLSTLLSDHPNPSFVNSVCTMLREGSWPWADTQWDSNYPITWDNSLIHPNSSSEQDFVESQSLIEEEAGRYSPAFGPDLLPGMYSTPMFAVPKPKSHKLRLVSHMSAGPFCQNSMMDFTETKGAHLDTMHNFVAAVLHYRRQHPDTKLVLFKSDVQGAYHLVPAHPLSGRHNQLPNKRGSCPGHQSWSSSKMS